MKERCQWCLVILLGVGILTANRELEIVSVVLTSLKGFIPLIRIFFD